MNDLISRQAAIATAISGRVRTLPTTEGGENWIRVNEVRDSLLSLPSAERRGRWVKQYDEEDYPLGCKCSECEKVYVMPEGWANFCPNCGARMDGEEK